MYAFNFFLLIKELERVLINVKLKCYELCTYNQIQYHFALIPAKDLN